MDALTSDILDDGVEAALRSEERRLLGARLSLGLKATLCALPAYAIADPFLNPRVLGPLYALKGIEVFVAAVGLYILRRKTSMRWAVCVGLLNVTSLAVFAAATGIVEGNDSTSPILATLLVMLSATAFPWGVGPHLVAVAAACLAATWNVLGVHGSFPARYGFGVSVLAVVCLGSLYLARELARNRRAVVLENLSRRRTRETLARSEQRYRELFENATDIVYTHDMNGVVTSINRAGERITGYAKREILGKPIAEVVAAEDVGKVKDTMRIEAGGGKARTCELEIISKDGRRVPMEVSTTLIVQDGSPVGVQGIGRDLTERKKAQAVIAASRRKIEADAAVFAALTHVGRALTSSLDRPVILNRLCEVAAEVIGCEISHTYLLQEGDIFVPAATFGETAEDREWVRLLKIPRATIQELLDLLAREDVVEIVLSRSKHPLRGVGQKYGMTTNMCIALRRGSEIIGFHVAAYRNREERFSERQLRIARGIAQLASLALENARLVEELESANRLKTDFLASVSHELRTPLNVILGYDALLLEGEFGPLAGEQREILERLGRHARDLFELISTTLDLSRLEAGRLPVRVEETDLPALLAEIHADVRERYGNPAVRLSVDVAGALPRVRTDRLKLKVILMNLLGNAMKFTTKGSVTARAIALPDGIEIAVEDTGIGMSPETRAVIFEPFCQGDDGRGSAFGGVGLGLYVVAKLLEILGGTIDVESEIDAGTVFRVRLPLDMPGEHVLDNFGGR